MIFRLVRDGTQIVLPGRCFLCRPRVQRRSVCATKRPSILVNSSSARDSRWRTWNLEFLSTVSTKVSPGNKKTFRKLLKENSRAVTIGDVTAKKGILVKPVHNACIGRSKSEAAIAKRRVKHWSNGTFQKRCELERDGETLSNARSTTAGSRRASVRKIVGFL